METRLTGAEPGPEKGFRSGLLVDWGGVLTTSPFDSFATFEAAEGLAPDSVASAFAVGGALHPLILGLETGAVADEAFERRLAAGLGLGPDRAEGLRTRLFAGMRSNHDLRRAVWALRQSGVRTCLLSNSVGSGSYHERTVAELFDATVISGEVGVRKPDPEIYAIAVERSGLPPEQLVFVDDIDANLAPAAELGIATVLHRESPATAARLTALFGVELPLLGAV